jgi:hypothetical protein
MTENIRNTRIEQDQLVVNELRRDGVEVNSVFDLVNDRGSHSGAIRALIRVLPQVSDQWIKQGVVRALTDPAARGVAGKPLLAELRAARDSGEESLAWAIGNALTVVADAAVLDDLLELAFDQRLGRARQTVVLALTRFRRDARVVQTLTALLDDENVVVHVLTALRRLKAVEAKEWVMPLVRHENRLIRREAEKTLKALQSSHD